MEPMLETAEAARRLGVKVSTLYAYVSRGLLQSVRSPDGRHSLFALEDVERLARRGRGGRQVETRLATITTSVTQIRDEGPCFRGAAATELARSTPFEAVAARLWEREPDDWTPADIGPAPVSESGRLRDRMAWTTVMSAAHDRVRSDLRPEAVIGVAARLISSMVASLGGPPGPDPSSVASSRSESSPAAAVPGSIAGRLSRALVGDRSRAGAASVVDAALVLLADHELATSTLAVRIAASTRASVYDAVLAGLGTMAGPLHGGASEQAYRLLDDAAARGAGPAVDDALRWHRHVAGFGHTVYRHGDPRAGVLLDLLEEAVPAASTRPVRELIGLAAEHGLPDPNVDLALAALARALGAPADAGEAIFTVARTAGWVAHYLEELDQPPLRFRARAVYATGR